MDKWAALGDKRRNHHPDELESPRPHKESRKSRRKEGESNSPKHRAFQNSHRIELLNKDWRRDAGPTSKPKNQLASPPPAANSEALLDDDFDWIGGWHDLHI
jgi:hypothetical protein